MSVEVINTISPTTGETVITRNGASSADLEQLPKVAADAFQSFRKATLKERQEIVKKFLKGLADRESELAEELTVQMGRPIAFTGKEITTAVKRGEYLLKVSDEALKDTDGEAEKGFKRFIRKVPVGPVLVIFAWNVSLQQPKSVAIFGRRRFIGRQSLTNVSVSLPDSRQLFDSRHSGRQQCHPQAVSPDSHHCGASV